MVILVDNNEVDFISILQQSVQDFDKEGEDFYGPVEWSRLVLMQDRTEWMAQLWQNDASFQLAVELFIRKHLVRGIKSSPKIILVP